MHHVKPSKQEYIILLHKYSKTNILGPANKNYYGQKKLEKIAVFSPNLRNIIHDPQLKFKIRIWATTFWNLLDIMA